ncbi:MAG TPA: N-formylglutamate amidohydrolase [Candidatus Polarisedimenticolaceae bacterium]|nr:N-formylglutamate amidohydrolase [Candidatus Polarisedimenticolaceae bacterium]
MPASATPPAFLRRGPRALGAVVLTCEHASRRLPPPLAPRASERRLLASHWGWDPGAWSLTAAIARRLGTTAVGGRWSRLWIDLNRDVRDPTLVRAEAGGACPSWNERCGAAELERRIERGYLPYHLEVERQIARRLVRGVRPMVLAVHSFTAELEGRVRDFDIGVLFDHHGGPARRLGRSLAADGLRVRYNQPYSGRAGMMYSAERHGAAYGLVCLELEVNQARLARPGFGEWLAGRVVRALGVGRGAADLERR